MSIGFTYNHLWKELRESQWFEKETTYLGECKNDKQLQLKQGQEGFCWSPSIFIATP